MIHQALSTACNSPPRAPRARPSRPLLARAREIACRCVEDRHGASFVEYVIVVGLVAIIAIVAFQNFGQAIVDKLTEETDAVKALQIQGGGGP